MQHIETVTVGAGGAASITFSAIPDTFTDLLLVASARSTGTDNNGGAQLFIRPNGLTTNQTFRNLGGNGSSAYTDTDTAIRTRMNPSDLQSNTFGNSAIYMPNYRSSSAKSFSLDGLFENNATFARMELAAALWNSSDPITSITLVSGSGNLAQYSTFSLYGILAGTSGGVTVS